MAVLVRELEGLDHVADGLRHLPAPDRPVAVDVQTPVQRDARGVEHGRPVDAVRLEDVLTDQMLGVASRPELLVERTLRIAQRGDVVDQGVEPDIRDVLVVEGQRYAPLQPRLGPADREIQERFAQEAQHLVPIALRLDEARIVLEVLDQPLLVLRHLEEVVLLLDEGERRLMVRTLAVDDLLLGVEALAAVAVPAAVLAEVDLARVVELLENGLHDDSVARLGRADEVVVGDAEALPGLSERQGVGVGVRLGRHAGRGGRLGHLVAVLVGAGQEIDAVTAQATVAAHGVGHDGRTRVPQMRPRVDIVDRRRQVESAVGHPSLTWRARRSRNRGTGRA